MLTTLVSMVEFVLINKNVYDGYLFDDYGKFNYNHVIRLENYAHFLSQKLTLGMFVPVDEKGNVLEEPKQYIGALELAIGKEYNDSLAYKEAISKVLFEGFEWISAMRQAKSSKCVVDKMVLDKGHHTIESLLNYDITLTKTAIKQIYG